jgi:hypothetical protein
MEVIVKRGKKKTPINDSLIKIYQDGKFSLTKVAADAIGVGNRDGIMFIFNEKEGKAYIMKDEEDDAFVISQKGNLYRFSSKELFDFFDKTFKLYETDKRSYVFKVDTEPVNGRHSIHLME